MTQADKVNPQHYKTGAGFQAIDVIEAFELDFCLGNAVKYILRAGKKPSEDEVIDLAKAAWYINRRVQQLKRGRVRTPCTRKP